MDYWHSAGQTPHYDVLVIGSLVADISCTHAPFESSGDSEPQRGSSNPAVITQCVGGVAHNIALAAHYSGAKVLLASVVADDAAGNFILSELPKKGLTTSAVTRLPLSDGIRTGQYVGNYSADKKLIFGMADVSIMQHSTVSSAALWSTLILESRPRWIIVDTCFPHCVMSTIVTYAREVEAQIVLEPVSNPRAQKLFEEFLPLPKGKIDLVTPSTAELRAMHSGASVHQLIQRPDNETSAFLSRTLDEPLFSIASMAVNLLTFFRAILTTCGEKGCVLAQTLSREDVAQLDGHDRQFVFKPELQEKAIYIRHFPPPRILSGDELVSVNGAGDSLVGALVAGLVQSSDQEDPLSPVLSADLIMRGQEAAAMTLKSPDAVTPDIVQLAQRQTQQKL